VISNSEMIRIRRQMQRRIQDVVAERRRARQMESVADLTGDQPTAHPDQSLTPAP
jgi:hypothetical protein